MFSASFITDHHIILLEASSTFRVMGRKPLSWVAKNARRADIFFKNDAGTEKWTNHKPINPECELAHGPTSGMRDFLQRD
jgi:hypothetical protein